LDPADLNDELEVGELVGLNVDGRGGIEANGAGGLVPGSPYLGPVESLEFA